MELYCNCIEFGYGAYSIKEAAMKYYHVHPKDLTLRQSMEIIAVLPAPKKYDLLSNNDLFQKSLSHIIALISEFIRPEDKISFFENGDLSKTFSSDYSAAFYREYCEKRENNKVLLPKYR